mgnify:CR=1 FL=1
MLTSGTRHVKKIFTIIRWRELQCVLRTRCSSRRAAYYASWHTKHCPRNKIALHSTQRDSLRKTMSYAEGGTT